MRIHVSDSTCAPDILHAGGAGERHGHVELVAQDLDRPRDAGLPAGAQAVQIGTTDHAGARAERERPHHVLTRANAAVEHDLDRGADGVDDPGQRGDRGHGAVELPAAVIGDDERRRAGLGRALGVLHVEQPLEHQRARPQVPDPFDVLPAQRRIELSGDPCRERAHALHAAHMARQIAEGLALAAQDARRPARLGRDVEQVAEPDLRRDRHAVAQVAMALPQHLQIDREHQRAASRRDRPLDHLAHEATVFHHVELEPERPLDRGRDILDRADRHGGKAERDAGRLGGAAGQDLAVAPLHAAQPDRRQRERQRCRLARDGGAQIALRHVHQHALAQLDALEVRAVDPQRLLRVGATVGIVEEHSGDPAARLQPHVLDAGHHAHGPALMSARFASRGIRNHHRCGIASSCNAGCRPAPAARAERRCRPRGCLQARAGVPGRSRRR